jgi:uncharacterized membrane protein
MQSSFKQDHIEHGFTRDQRSISPAHSSAQSHMQKARFSAPLILILIATAVVFAGSAARLYGLDRMLVWHDEAFSLLRVFGFDADKVSEEVLSGRRLAPKDLLRFQQPSPELDFGDTLTSLKTHPEHGPLFYLAARAIVPVFPSALAGVRGASALFSLLLLPAVFWLAWELFDDAAAGWVAAALAACSPIQLLYAQEARQYALWTALSIAASAALLRALRRESPSDWILYSVLAALGLYTHLLFALVLAAHAVYILLSLRGTGFAAIARLRPWGTAVAAAVLMFSPWLVVLVSGFDRVQEKTAWMARAVPLQRLLEAWGLNLVRVFADVPGPSLPLFVGLIPLAWALWWFCTRAPRSPRLFLCALFLTFAAVVLVPDLINGGIRSLHPRYLLPAFVAVELAVAYVLAAGWNAPGSGGRIGSRAGLILILGLGLWSDWHILRADTWWTKNFSASNREVAALVNATERPLLVISDSDVGLGEALSLAHDLDDKVVIQGMPHGKKDLATAEFSDVFLLTPSAEVRTAFGAHYDLVPLLGSWQWYRAIPMAKGRGT